MPGLEARQELSSSAPPAAEDEAAEGQTESERSERERADRNRLAPQGEPPPAADGLLLVGAQGLAATLLTNGSACAKSEIHVVEDLGRLVRHGSSV